MSRTSPGGANRPPGRRTSRPGRSSGAGEGRGATSGVASSPQRFAERARATRRRSRTGALVALLLLLLAALVVWAVRFSSLFDVRSIEVVGAGGDVRTAVLQAVGPASGRPLAGEDLEAIGRRAAQVPAVEKADVSRSWPHTVKVDVTARVPVLAVKDGGSVRLVDRHGVAYGSQPSAPAGVPTVAAGDAADGVALAGAVSMMSALPPDLRARVGSVTVKSVSAMSFALGETTVLWGDASQPDLKVKVLRALLVGKPKVIDVSAPQAPATS